MELTRTEIPKQKILTVSEATVATVSTASDTTQAATAATLGANVLMSGAMSQIWGMINGLQIIVNLPLFFIEFPSLAIMMVNSLITIATFDVMPSDEVFELTIDAPEDEQEDEKFQDVDFESNYMILNMGTMFLMFIVLLIIPCILLCSRPCRSCSRWLNKKHGAMSESMKGNSWIRFVMEGSLDISICASLNYIYLGD